MGRSWHWDFEDHHWGAARKPAAPTTGEPQVDPRAHFRRRRRGVALASGMVLLLIVGALSGGHHHGASAAARAAAAAHRASGGGAGQPGQSGTAGENKAVASILAYTPFVRKGAGTKRDVALTFDDGPGPYTPGVLSVLERLHVRATFFAIGKMERYFSPSTSREIRDGDVVGDHTETHPMLAHLSAHEQYEELFEQIARIELLGGPRPTLFRPPYGSFNATTIRELRALHLLMVMWSVDAGDYLQPGVPAIVEHTLAGVRPGAIILMHDAGGVRTQTIAALPIIIHALRARGYHLVTVPQLLADEPPPSGQPLPPNLSGD